MAHYLPGSGLADASTRVKEFQNITQDQLNALKTMCMKRIFNPTLAEDAFAHAIAVAYERYDGRVPLKHYVGRVAVNFAISESRGHDRGHATQFTDLETRYLDDVTGHLDESISPVANLEDPNDHFAHIEDSAQVSWAEQAMAVLRDEASDPRLSRGTRLKAKRAAAIFEQIIQASRSDSPLAELIEQPQGKSHVRKSLEVTYAELLNETESNIEVAMTYLRQKIQKLLPVEQRNLIHQWS